MKSAGNLTKMFLIFFIGIFFVSCENEDKHLQNFQLTCNNNYEVKIAWENGGCVGILNVNDDGSLSFFHNSPLSPLFGMEERAGENFYRSAYQGILWESIEIETPLQRIYRLLKSLREAIPFSVEETDDSYFIHYRPESGSVNIFINKDSGQPKRICSDTDDCRLEIIFQ